VVYILSPLVASFSSSVMWKGGDPAARAGRARGGGGT